MIYLLVDCLDSAFVVVDALGFFLSLGVLGCLVVVVVVDAIVVLKWL